MNSNEQYGSRIEEIIGDEIVIAMPMSKGYPVMLAQGQSFTGQFIIDGAVYQFTSKLLRKTIHPIPTWVVCLPQELKKVQLRSFVRTSAMIPVQFKLLAQDEAGAAVDTPTFNVQTKDISGGGLQIVARQTFEIGAKGQLIIDIPGSDSFLAIGEVVRVEQPQAENPIFWVGIKFIEIQERDRSKLIKYIFKKQLEQRQKGV
ncbi:c-di-GMP-binding flagellar brake protein YcgR [Anaerospora hongkongensis]|uniref:C-di-GMP-binding flagellar brake protein YcgR n=1 Tax=Anaerospora hongkongensis TaxID=244830 RepID=A0A4R1Q6C5_9FIRM|nr:c-di-GMP-binding flagellar brake protein YcgR [Anaerospora hongkongensis]